MSNDEPTNEMTQEISKSPQPLFLATVRRKTLFVANISNVFEGATLTSFFPVLSVRRLCGRRGMMAMTYMNSVHKYVSLSMHLRANAVVLAARS